MLANLKATFGYVPRWSPDLWPAFETVSMQILTDAFAAMSKEKLYDLAWDENTFSALLVWYIWAELLRLQIPFVAQPECMIFVRELVTSRQSGTLKKFRVKKAPRIDLTIRYCGMPPEQYFGVEAKLLTNQTFRKRTINGLSSAYVSAGVARYRSGLYAEDVNSAAMIGYVLVGPCEPVLSAIRDAIEKTFPGESHMEDVAAPFDSCTRFRTVHQRSVGGPIQLFHLIVGL